MGNVFGSNAGYNFNNYSLNTIEDIKNKMGITI